MSAPNRFPEMFGDGVSKNPRVSRFSLVTLECVHDTDVRADAPVDISLKRVSQPGPPGVSPRPG